MIYGYRDIDEVAAENFALSAAFVKDQRLTARPVPNMQGNGRAFAPRSFLDRKRPLRGLHAECGDPI
jgi:hypothetical protein